MPFLVVFFIDNHDWFLIRVRSSIEDEEQLTTLYEQTFRVSLSNLVVEVVIMDFFFSSVILYYDLRDLVVMVHYQDRDVEDKVVN